MSLTYKDLKIKNLTFSFQKRQILKDINLTFNPGSFSLITGPTGSGKSTFLKLLAGLYPKFGGKINSGQIINQPQNWGMVFQDPNKQFTMATPRQELVFTLENLCLDADHAAKRIKQAAQETQIQDLLDRKFISLSGGEKQRVAFSVMLAMRPQLLLLDEAFASCDKKNRQFLMKHLQTLKNAHTTIIAVDHNLDGYNTLADEVYEFKDYQFKLLNNQERVNIFSKNKPAQLQFALPQNNNLIFETDNFSYKQGQKELVKHAKFNINNGASILLTGENGAGKSSLFKVLTKLLPYQGQLLYKHQPVNKLKAKFYLQHVSQVFQDPDNQFLMVTVGEELQLSKKHNHNPLLSDEKIAQIVNDLDLNRPKQIVYSLSGGQKKKLQILLMLIANPEILLLDEPFAGLDEASTKQVISMIKNNYLNQNRSLIIISHQFSQIENLCDYHLHLANQKLSYLQN